MLRSFGADGLRKMIRNHVAWTRRIAKRIDRHPRLERIAEVSFALVAFAHRDGNTATDDLVERINRDGRFYITASEVDGRRYARIVLVRPGLPRLISTLCGT